MKKLKKTSTDLNTITEQLKEAFELIATGRNSEFEEAMTLATTEELLNLMREKIFQAELHVEALKYAKYNNLTDQETRLIATSSQDYRKELEEELEANS